MKNNEHKETSIYDQILEFEKKYGGKWGNQISLSDMENQTSFNDFTADEDLICQECKVEG